MISISSPGNRIWGGAFLGCGRIVADTIAQDTHGFYRGLFSPIRTVEILTERIAESPVGIERFMRARRWREPVLSRVLLTPRILAGAF